MSAGCFSKPEFRGDGPADAKIDAFADGGGPMDTPCTGAWGSPSLRHELDNDVTGEPAITSDLLTLYYAHQLGGSQWEIRWADRGSDTQPFSPHGKVTFDSGSTLDQDPSVTDDGKLVLYRSGTSGILMQASKDTGSWVTGPVPGLPSLVPDTLDISGDGNTLYYSKNGMLLVATRTMRSQPFTEATGNIGTGFYWASVAGDGTHLYYTMQPSTYGVYEATRAGQTGSFSGSTMLLGSSYYDPDVTTGGDVLVVGERTNQTVAFLRRGCP